MGKENTTSTYLNLPYISFAREESLHNLQDSHHLRDPLLTGTGKAQCKELQKEFPFLRNVEVVLASPLRRTIQTAAYVFAPELEARQLPIVLVPNAQEISHLTCDLGYEAAITKGEAPKLIADVAPSYDAANLDMALVDESWNSKVGFYDKDNVKSHDTG